MQGGRGGGFHTCTHPCIVGMNVQAYAAYGSLCWGRAGRGVCVEGLVKTYLYPWKFGVGVAGRTQAPAAHCMPCRGHHHPRKPSQCPPGEPETACLDQPPAHHSSSVDVHQANIPPPLPTPRVGNLRQVRRHRASMSLALISLRKPAMLKGSWSLAPGQLPVSLFQTADRCISSRSSRIEVA